MEKAKCLVVESTAQHRHRNWNWRLDGITTPQKLYQSACNVGMRAIELGGSFVKELASGDAIAWLVALVRVGEVGELMCGIECGIAGRSGERSEVGAR